MDRPESAVYIYSVSRGPLRKVDVAVARAHLAAISFVRARLDSFSRGTIRQMDVAEGPL